MDYLETDAYGIQVTKACYLVLLYGSAEGLYTCITLDHTSSSLHKPGQAIGQPRLARCSSARWQNTSKAINACMLAANHFCDLLCLFVVRN